MLTLIHKDGTEKPFKAKPKENLMFAFTPVTAERVTKAITDNLTVIPTNQDDMGIFDVSEWIVEEVSIASQTNDYVLLSDSFQEVATYMDRSNPQFSQYFNNLVDLYADLFSLDVADDLRSNWSSFFGQ